ncbi:MAG: tol-pal system YbgF family protein [Phycisphaerae bacterium]
MGEVRADTPSTGEGAPNEAGGASTSGTRSPNATEASSTAGATIASATSGAGTSGPAARSEPQIVDVWSRTQPKYRVRAIVLLVVNLLLFCGLCAFAHWLHAARAFDFSPSSYYAPARFWDAASPNLNDFILAPINVVDVPLHAIVLGLVVAVIVAVPIVVSILYRLRSALPFLAAVLVFAHMPWFAVTLLASCLLASVRPFRMSFRFGSALAGLLPVLLYLYLATRGTPDQLASYGSPAQKSLLVAPWLLAILAASVMLGAVLLIARVVNYRPGAIAPVLAVMFATPLVLFHAAVGVDELAYRVLEAEYGPLSKRFEPVLKSRETQNAILDLISDAIGDSSFSGQLRSDLLGLWSLQPEKLRELKRTVSRRFLAAFLSDRSEANEACKQFIADYPQSRYVPSVLYIQARVLDTRLDEAKLARDEPYRELYTDFPHVESEQVWLKLLKQYPHSQFFVIAALRLAELKLRAGEVDEALRNLRLVLDEAPNHANGPSTTQPRHRHLLAAASPESSLDFQPKPYRREVRRLAELIVENRHDPQYGNAALVELAALDPRRARYLEQLQRLAQRYHDSVLYDNLVVRWAGALPEMNERVAALEGCLRTFASGDALPEALYRLANLEIQALAAEDESRRARGIARLREIVARFPESCWAQRAAERLEVLEPRTVENGVKP